MVEHRAHRKDCSQLKNKCEFCNKNYEFKQSLWKHQRTQHPKEFPRQCEYCPRAFKRSSELAAHKQELHSKSNGPMIKCDLKNCGKILLSLFQKDEHIEKMHPDYRYACSYCNYDTNTRKNLAKHERNKHLIQQKVLSPQQNSYI